jgi:hypothetical protein
MAHGITSRITPKITIELDHDAATSAAAAMAIHHPTTLLTADDHRHPPHQSSAPLALAALDTTTSCADITNRQHNNSIAITFYLHSFAPKPSI